MLTDSQAVSQRTSREASRAATPSAAPLDDEPSPVRPVSVASTTATSATSTEPIGVRAGSASTPAKAVTAQDVEDDVKDGDDDLEIGR